MCSYSAAVLIPNASRVHVHVGFESVQTAHKQPCIMHTWPLCVARYQIIGSKSACQRCNMQCFSCWCTYAHAGSPADACMHMHAECGDQWRRLPARQPGKLPGQMHRPGQPKRRILPRHSFWSWSGSRRVPLLQHLFSGHSYCQFSLIASKHQAS